MTTGTKITEKSTVVEFMSIFDLSSKTTDYPDAVKRVLDCMRDEQFGFLERLRQERLNLLSDLKELLTLQKYHFMVEQTTPLAVKLCEIALGWFDTEEMRSSCKLQEINNLVKTVVLVYTLLCIINLHEDILERYGNPTGIQYEQDKRYNFVKSHVQYFQHQWKLARLPQGADQFKRKAPDEKEEEEKKKKAAAVLAIQQAGEEALSKQQAGGQASSKQQAARPRQHGIIARGSQGMGPLIQSTCPVVYSPLREEMNMFDHKISSWDILKGKADATSFFTALGLAVTREWFHDRLSYSHFMVFSTVSASLDYRIPDGPVVAPNGRGKNPERYGGGVRAVHPVSGAPLQVESAPSSSAQPPNVPEDWQGAGSKLRGFEELLDGLDGDMQPTVANQRGQESELKATFVAAGSYNSVWIVETYGLTTQRFPEYVRARLPNSVLRVPRLEALSTDTHAGDFTIEQLMNTAEAAAGGFGPDVLLTFGRIDVSQGMTRARFKVYQVVERLPWSLQSLFSPQLNEVHARHQQLVSRLAQMLKQLLFDISVRRIFHLDLSLNNIMGATQRSDDGRQSLRNVQDTLGSPGRSTEYKFLDTARLTEQLLAIDLDPHFYRRLVPDSTDLKEYKPDCRGCYAWNLLFVAMMLKRFGSNQAFIQFIGQSGAANIPVCWKKHAVGVDYTLVASLSFMIDCDEAEMMKRQEELHKKIMEQPGSPVRISPQDPTATKWPAPLSVWEPQLSGFLWLIHAQWNDAAAGARRNFENTPVGKTSPTGYETINPQLIRAYYALQDMPKIIDYWFVQDHENNAVARLSNWANDEIQLNKAVHLSLVRDPLAARESIEQRRMELERDIVRKAASHYLFLKEMKTKGMPLVRVMQAFVAHDFSEWRPSLTKKDLGYQFLASELSGFRPTPPADAKKSVKRQWQMWLAKYTGFETPWDRLPLPPDGCLR